MFLEQLPEELGFGHDDVLVGVVVVTVEVFEGGVALLPADLALVDGPVDHFVQDHDVTVAAVVRHLYFIPQHQIRRGDSLLEGVFFFIVLAFLHP